MMDCSIFSRKSKESLGAAVSCFENEYYNSCVNRAYYAMFQVALAALLKSGVKPKAKKIGHDWVQAEFSRLFILRSKQFPHLKGLLTWVQKWRNTADYSDEEIGKKKAKRVLERAEVFVKDVSRRIDNDS
ncbi:HEPN domain-containing protein [Desulfobacterales bacterium HSG2]|nr:HEPN domain-containing protein [Desulfobacterales bacterium HSG2]